MNRPRNRQPRPGGNTTNRPGGNRQQYQPRSGASDNRNANVPTTQQVQRGAAVSIVLKEDQGTGREVQGVVQDLLTRGNHPRGIKVRLQDGRIGRVQRMATGSVTAASQSTSTVRTLPASATPDSERRRDATRSYSTMTPDAGETGSNTAFQDDGDEFSTPQNDASFVTATVKCPICGDFEGDEAAVSHHVQDHLD